MYHCQVNQKLAKRSCYSNRLQFFAADQVGHLLSRRIANAPLTCGLCDLSAKFAGGRLWLQVMEHRNHRNPNNQSKQHVLGTGLDISITKVDGRFMSLFFVKSQTGSVVTLWRQQCGIGDS